MMKLSQFLDVLGRSNSGFVSIFVVVVGVILLASWASYAYFNPHTPSGQLLIRVNSDFFFLKKNTQDDIKKRYLCGSSYFMLQKDKFSCEKILILFKILLLFLQIFRFICVDNFNDIIPSIMFQYRPSRWHMPSSHVRYSASVHM